MCDTIVAPNPYNGNDTHPYKTLYQFVLYHPLPVRPLPPLPDDYTSQPPFKFNGNPSHHLPQGHGSPHYRPHLPHR